MFRSLTHAICLLPLAVCPAKATPQLSEDEAAVQTQFIYRQNFREMSDAIVHVDRVQTVQGGRSKWDGALMTGTVTYSGGENILKLRVLFRFDPRDERWYWKVLDFVPMMGEFSSSGVPDWLAQD